MRNLNADDLFRFTALIKVVGAKEEFAKIKEQVAEKKNINAKEIGTELVLNILSNCGTEDAKNTIFEFLSGPIEMSTKEIASMDIRTFIDTVEKFIEQNAEDLKYFFKKALGLIKSK